MRKQRLRRTPERVKEIDAFIRANYDERGCKYVAEHLGESRVYITGRNSYLKSKAPHPDQLLLDDKDVRIIRLTERITELEKYNHTLREELIRLIHKCK